MRRLLTAVALLLLAPSAGAQEIWYDVEIMIFARADQKYADSEVWPTGFTPLEQPRVTDLKPAPTDATAAPEPFQRLPESALRLNAEWQKLHARSAFEPLLYTGWRQPGLAREAAIAVRLGEAEPPAPADAATPADPSAEPQPLPRLEGTVRLVLARYLHLETDLRYRTPEQAAAATDAVPTTADDAYAPPVMEDDSLLFPLDGEAAASAPEPPAYLLRDSRRMRSRELHYLDHPMFGLLVLVTPYEAPKEPAPPATPAPASTPAAAAAKPATPPAKPVDPATGGAIRRN